jgi:hypothetical protein
MHLSDPCVQEKRLIVACILRAVADIHLPKGGTEDRLRLRQALRGAAYSWLFSDVEYSENGFTFLMCCDALDIDPHKLREALPTEETWEEVRPSMFRYKHVYGAKPTEGS